MKIYVSRRDEQVTAKLDETYSNEQTVMLEYLTGDKAGKTTPITHSTLKRWWRETEVEDPVEEIPFESEPIDPEDVGMAVEEAGLVPMPGIEKLENPKKQYTGRSKTGKEDISVLIQPYTQGILDIGYGFSIFSSSPGSMKVTGKNKKTICYIDFRRKGIRIYPNGYSGRCISMDWISVPEFLNNLMNIR